MVAGHAGLCQACAHGRAEWCIHTADEYGYYREAGVAARGRDCIESYAIQKPRAGLSLVLLVLLS